MEYEFDPELKYCPQCNDEYRSEIVTCASCAVELLTGAQMIELASQKMEKKAQRNMHLSPDDELVSIRKGPVMEMKEIQILLEKEGIPSLAVKDTSNCGQGCCGTDLIIKVRVSEVEDVLEILEQEHVRATSLEDHDTTHAGAVFNTAAENATCPACGYVFSTSKPVCPDCGLVLFFI